MTRPARLVLLAGVIATGVLVVLATATGTARVGPVVFWAVHREELAGGSEVALRPGLGLLGLWLFVLAAVVVISRRRDV
ncbi:MAG: hypothetical protein JNK12_17995 [Acidimicrobiales bacterium]|nr:hypothetical protein [Acidimicrobiales bacterium]